MNKPRDIESVVNRFKEITELLADPGVHADRKRFGSLAKEQSELEPIAMKELECRKLREEIRESEEILAGDDDELKEIAAAEIGELRENLSRLEAETRELLLPKDPDDVKNAIVEIRAGTGGDEAAIFAADLYRMYMKYIESRNWKAEHLSGSPTGIGGLKEAAFAVTGREAYGTLKYESGVHRVQRVPVTESSGRIHTSAASVVVLPEADDVELGIDPNDLKIDVYRSTGPGGQSVNTTDSAVRITHIPTGLVVTCQDEKSQYKNKAKALKVLRARLFDARKKELDDARAADRRSQVGSGDRSAKVRTYNFPQNRVTDHRINLTLHNLEDVMNGDIQRLIDANRLQARADLLKQAGAPE